MSDTFSTEAPIGKTLHVTREIEPDDVNPDTLIDAFAQAVRSLEFHAEVPAAAVDWNSVEVLLFQPSHSVIEHWGQVGPISTIQGPMLIRVSVDVLEA